jgi:hypothetical protein
MCTARRGSRLQNPNPCDPVWERCHNVFGKRSITTTDFIFITDAEDFLPDDDIFPDISNLFNKMGDNNSNTKANAGSTSRLYVILPPLYAIMLQMLILVIGPDLLLVKTLFLSIYLDLVLFHSLLACMTSLISNLVMFYMLD